MFAGISKLKGLRRTAIAAALGISAVMIGLAAPAGTAFAAVPTAMVDGKPVMLTETGTHNWSSLSRSRGTTMNLKDGSLGEVWNFESRGNECLVITMKSDDFSPYISLRTGGPFGNEIAYDNGSGDNWATIRGTVPRGDLYLMATSSGRGQKEGKYTLDITHC